MKKVLLIVLCALVAVSLITAGICAVIWNQNEFTLDLTLSGDREITLEYGSEFTDPGASASFYGTLLNRKPKDVEVLVEGSVDTSKLGDYTLTYSAGYNADYKLVHEELTQTQERIVHIVDTQAPTITLVTNPEHFTFPNEKYQEEGFSAFDGYDGDITHLVTAVEENGQVTYTVTDSSGNRFETVRIIVYDDPVPPTLTLEGGNLEWKFGEAFVEPGYTALDNCDGDITDRVQIESNLDVNVPGTYILTYTVADNYGNIATAQREVKVQPQYPNLPDIVLNFPDPALPSNGKVIYLTFDDGPSKYTPQLLDILAKYGVKATFFVVRNGYSDIITRIARSGHTVAMHTATHDYETIYASEEAYFNDLYAIQALIQEKTGVSPNLLRFPGGSSNGVSRFNPGIMTRLTKEVQERGFYYFDWNVDSKDAGGATSTIEVVYNTIAGIMKHGTSVVLQHDTSYYSVMAVDTIIRWGLANGYSFRTLSESGPVCHHGVRN